MGVENELVERVVRMQLSSPNFAEYCVSHVTDPKHRFLFARDDDSADRRLYVRLLEQASSQATTSAAASGLSCSPMNSCITTLWASLLDYFSMARAVRGPHVPHMFRSEDELAKFVDMLERAQRDHDSRLSVVQFMLRRLPMTETFLYVLCYLCDLHVHEAREATRCRDASAANSADAAEMSLQAAGTLVFTVNMLMLEHESLERPLRYLAVFEVYLRRMVEMLAGATQQDSQVGTFLRETLAVWAESKFFGEETLRRMKQAVGIGDDIPFRGP